VAIFATAPYSSFWLTHKRLLLTRLYLYHFKLFVRRGYRRRAHCLAGPPHVCLTRRTLRTLPAFVLLGVVPKYYSVRRRQGWHAARLGTGLPEHLCASDSPLNLSPSCSRGFLLASSPLPPALCLALKQRTTWARLLAGSRLQHGCLLITFIPQQRVLGCRIRPASCPPGQRSNGSRTRRVAHAAAYPRSFIATPSPLHLLAFGTAFTDLCCHTCLRISKHFAFCDASPALVLALILYTIHPLERWQRSPPAAIQQRWTAAA